MLSSMKEKGNGNGPKQLREVKKLGDELLHVAHVGQAEMPRRLHRIEQAVWQIKPSPLQLDSQRGIGLQPQQVVQSNASRGVM